MLEIEVNLKHRDSVKPTCIYISTSCSGLMCNKRVHSCSRCTQIQCTEQGTQIRTDRGWTGCWHQCHLEVVASGIQHCASSILPVIYIYPALLRPVTLTGSIVRGIVLRYPKLRTPFNVRIQARVRPPYINRFAAVMSCHHHSFVSIYAQKLDTLHTELCNKLLDWKV